MHLIGPTPQERMLLGKYTEHSKAQLKGFLEKAKNYPIAEGAMSKARRDTFQSLMAIECLPNRSITEHGIVIKRDELETLEGIIAAAVMKAREGKFRTSFEYLETTLKVIFELDEVWLTLDFGRNANDKREELDPKKFEFVVSGLVSLSRIWLSASACQMVGVKVEGAEAFRLENSNSIMLPYFAVPALAKFGWLEDICPMEIVGNNCGEGYARGECADANRLIVSAVPVVAYLSENNSPDKRFNDVNWKIHLSALMRVMGLDLILTQLPNFGGLESKPMKEAFFGSGYEEIVRLMKYKDDMKLDFGLTCGGDITEARHETYRFLKLAGVVEDVERPYCRLTEKGKELVRGIFEVAIRTRVRFEPKQYPPHVVEVIAKGAKEGAVTLLPPSSPEQAPRENKA